MLTHRPSPPRTSELLSVERWEMCGCTACCIATGYVARGRRGVTEVEGSCGWRRTVVPREERRLSHTGYRNEMAERSLQMWLARSDME